MRRWLVLLVLLAVLLAPAPAWAALFCDGTDDEISLDNLGVNGATRLSFAFWLYVEDIGDAESGIIAKMDSSGSDGFYLAVGSGSNTLWFNFGAANNHGLFAATANTWNHWVVVWDGNLTGNSNRLRVWKDGAELAANSFTGTILAAIATITDPVRVCRNLRNAGAGQYGRVRLANLMMWVGRALTIGEAAAQYHLSTPMTTDNARLWMRFEGTGASLGENLAGGEPGTVLGATPSFGPPLTGQGGD